MSSSNLTGIYSTLLNTQTTMSNLNPVTQRTFVLAFLN